MWNVGGLYEDGRPPSGGPTGESEIVGPVKEEEGAMEMLLLVTELQYFIRGESTN